MRMLPGTKIQSETTIFKTLEVDSGEPLVVASWESVHTVL